ncbi:MAG: hypothetical protein HYU97_01710 [Deltaproteobacteria bacterium]|nr:hypothetical protein [Deltaproteobacteria bacterium]
MQLSFPDLKKNLIHWLGFPHMTTFLELDQKLSKIERDLDRYRTKLRHKRLRRSYEEIMNTIKPVVSPLPKVVVVDLETNTHEVFKKSLEKKFDILIIPSIEEALKVADTERPAFFFFERALLGQSGAKHALEVFQQNHPEIKFVSLNSYLTSLITKDSQDPIPLAGSLQKPIRVEELGQVVNG